MNRLLELWRDVSALDAALSLLGWDRVVLMPSGGSDARAAHTALLAARRHRLLTSDEFGTALEAAEGDLEPAVVRVVQRERKKAMSLPESFVIRRAALTSEAYGVWRGAREANDFARMRPYYERIVDLVREESSLLDPHAAHVYDPLFDLYEEGSDYAQGRAMFDELGPAVKGLVAEIRESGVTIDDSALTPSGLDQAALARFVKGAMAHIGYDFDRGRHDLTPNAFCTHLASTDVRVTSRPSDHVKGVLSSSLHEMGHALYEQGVPRDWDGHPLAGGISLAVHESQSRLWENIVGRSASFWRFFFPALAQEVPALASMGAEGFWRAYTKVDPQPIRVGGDELTYNLHIMIRFELEVELLTGSLAVKDLPEAWNATYADNLGFRPATDAVGCLQDVHWSKGSLGYFPTYVMGNLIGGMLWKKMGDELGDLDGRMERGEFAEILGWLAEGIYRHGRRYTPSELLHRVCGEPLQAGDWLSYAGTKYRRLYGISG